MNRLAGACCGVKAHADTHWLKGVVFPLRHRDHEDAVLVCVGLLCDIIVAKTDNSLWKDATSAVEDSSGKDIILVRGDFEIDIILVAVHINQSNSCRIEVCIVKVGGYPGVTHGGYFEGIAAICCSSRDQLMIIKNTGANHWRAEAIPHYP
ncbi:MAG: hypothetical protein EBZ48_11995 [Proteobacteria bacterium]|nr:hypothetical protein [Pseudomonadota bacterium]